MNIGILGHGVQGRAAYEYWDRPENQLTIVIENATDYDPKGLADIDKYDLLVRAPSLRPGALVEAAGTPAILDKVTTVTNEFFRVCPTKNIIGVTGTKGKGTTSTFIAKMLEAAGKRVFLGGNIGVPPLDLLKHDIQSEDWVVLELANFQLIDLKYSPHIAVCVTVTPEHLDWHRNAEEYIEAKQQLFVHQSPDDVAIYYAKSQLSQEVASVSPAPKLPYYAAPGAYVEGDQILIDGTVVCKTDEIKILGKHNWQNICAAVTATWQITQDQAAIHTVVTSLGGLPHRLELVREFDGVAYYNDSFAATPLATVAAIEAIVQPKVLIVGGHDRGLELDALVKSLQEHRSDIRTVLLIGAAARRVADALKAKNIHSYTVVEAQTMPEIVEAARAAAQSGDAVVLSPGFASFDMFQNFEDRGDQFKAAVEAL